jgi:hypothetical protein
LTEHEAAEGFYQMMPGETLGAGKDEQRERYHVLLMMDAGLVTCVCRGIVRLTNSGHDYLEAIRDDGVWSRTRAAVAETGGSATLEIIKSLAMGFLKSKIEKHTGIQL